MAERTEYAPNTFCWPELMTSDAGGAKKFYAAVFGWDLADSPVGPDQIYTMATLGGKNVGALYQLNDAQRAQGVPPNWLSYVSVADLDATLARAKQLGAAIVVDAMDVFDIGRMAVVADPQGAAFALWQPKQHIGAQIVNEPGTLCWNELYTPNLDASGAFYTRLFDWTSRTDNMGSDVRYTTFSNGDRPAAGMMEIQKEWGQVPPHWMVYFAVADCDATVAEIETQGGRVMNKPMDIPEVGRFAVVSDPQGAVFAVIALNRPQD